MDRQGQSKFVAVEVIQLKKKKTIPKSNRKILEPKTISTPPQADRWPLTFMACYRHYDTLYNNTPSKAIVNAASNITYRRLIEADDTDHYTLIIWPIFGTRLIYVLHLSDVTLLFEQWIIFIFKNLQFILLFLNIRTLAFYCFRLKTRFTYYLSLVYLTLDSKLCKNKYQQFV